MGRKLRNLAGEKAKEETESRKEHPKMMGISRKSRAKRQLRLSRDASDHSSSGDSLPECPNPDHSLPQTSHSVPDDHEIDEPSPTSSGLLEDPAAPKEIERNAIARTIEIQPLLF